MADLLSLAFPAGPGVNMGETMLPFTNNQQLAGRYVQQAGNLRIQENQFRTSWMWQELQGVKSEAFKEWAELNFQGAIWYNPKSGQGAHYLGTGQPRIIESAGGKLFEIEIRNNLFDVRDISGGVKANPNFLLAWLCQGENYVVRTDGASATQIYDGKNPVFVSPGYNASVKSRSRFPNQAGPVAYAGGRFWVTTYGRQLIASDSLHQYNQKDAIDILRFEDQTYDYLNVAFFPPADDGDIVGLGISVNSGFNDARAQGELLAMCNGPSIWAAQLGIPREQWAQVKMRNSRSKETAATGPDAFFIRDGDILMRTPQGIQSLNMLQRDQSNIGNSAIDIGADIRQLLERDAEEDLLYASLINPTRWDAMYCTVSPQVDGLYRSHLGYCSLNWNPVEVRQPQGFSWEGLHMLPKEMGRIIKFLPVRVQGRSLIFALTLKPDGTKGICQLLKQDGNHRLADGTELPRQWYLLTKRIAAGGRWRDSEFRNAMLMLEDMRTDVAVEIEGRTNLEPCFRKLKRVEVKAHQKPFPACVATGERRIPLGNVIGSFKQGFTWVQFLVKGVGVTTVDFGVAGQQAGQESQEVSPSCVESLNQPSVPFDPFYPPL
jgi:hypothetical protein